MIVKLPLTTDCPQSVNCQLGDMLYQFDLRWNDRSNVWTMDISDPIAQQPLATGIPLVLGGPLIRQYALGIGEFVVWDETGTGTEATLTSLGTTTNVYWISPDEFPSGSPDA